MKLNAFVLLLGSTLVSLQTIAHGGEDHDHAETPAAAPAAAKQGLALSGERPQRLADGSVFVPKESQRRLLIRTALTQVRTLPVTVELNAHVVMDPNASGKVQSTQSGRLEAGPRGLPTLGQRVKKGQLLARVVPAISSLERGNQRAQIAELNAQLPVAQKRLARYRELEGTIARKDVDAAQAEVQSLRQRIAALSRGVDAAEALVAPVDGVIASANAVNGQVVDAQAVLFDIVDPKRLLVEALVYDPNLATQLTSATIAGESAPLRFIGAGAVLREGALPVLFRAQNADVRLALGQSLKLRAQTRKTLTGTPLPAAAVVRNAANETVVWLHSAPELFRAQAVKAQPLDGERVAVTGLQPNQRVVVSGATLLNQIR